MRLACTAPLPSDRRARKDINGGDTAQVAALGSWFRVVSTTANMLGSGTTSGHQIYILNLFKVPVTPLD